MKKIIAAIMMLGALVTSCENADWDFPDYGTTSVYFAKQTPIRTITLGTDTYDTTLDNEHKCQIMATIGGVYKNETNRIINFVVDESLCDGLTYKDGSDIIPMPSSYYTLASNKIIIPPGKVLGGVEVQLTDAFFNDPKSISTTYVIPLRMTNVENADTILKSKNYILYAVKYINKWAGNWLSRGTDVIDDNGSVTTVARKANYIENDEVRGLTTNAYKQVAYPVSTVVKVYNQDGTLGTKTLTCNLILTFDDNDKCTITSGTEGYSVTGNGTWTKEGAKKAWGDKDRDELKLNYVLTYQYKQKADGPTLYKKYTCDDTLVARDRGSKLETFTTKNK
ncbi:DUF5627 domain-containing protein [uncultured Bacteroides sp.]|jgi:hypothetical protein|uniref:DUF5627 domain-containing protein n=1 Tax=uncultured Bacteroides sp. TaxID=162156 RepID=UPI002AA8CE6E|nr:DUF5627 domain-containing protein [uncultured Bacteroides sp.]